MTEKWITYPAVTLTGRSLAHLVTTEFFRDVRTQCGRFVYTSMSRPADTKATRCVRCATRCANTAKGKRQVDLVDTEEL